MSHGPSQPRVFIVDGSGSAIVAHVVDVGGGVNGLVVTDPLAWAKLAIIESAFDYEGQAVGAPGRGVMLHGDDGADRKNVAVDATTGYVKCDAGGDVAHDAADSGKPLKIGGHAYAGVPPGVGDGDRVDARFTTKGALVVEPSGLGTQPVTDGGGSLSVDDNGGSLTVDGTVTETNSAAIKTAVEKIDDAVDSNQLRTEGDVAHDAVDSGNPMKMGAKAAAQGTAPTAVAANDRVNLAADRHGVQHVIGGNPATLRLHAQRTTAGTTTLKSVSAGKRFVVSAVSVYTKSANSSAIAGTIKLGTAIIAQHPGIAAGSGFVEGSGAGKLAEGGDGDDVTFTSDVAGTIDAQVTGYEIEG